MLEMTRTISAGKPGSAQASSRAWRLEPRPEMSTATFNLFTISGPSLGGVLDLALGLVTLTGADMADAKHRLAVLGQDAGGFGGVGLGDHDHHADTAIE